MYQRRDRDHAAGGTAGSQAPAPGKRTLAESTRPIQRKGGGPPAGEATSRGGSGQPLPDPVRAKMETSFGADFSTVRVHDGGAMPAPGTAAFASGEDVHFAAGTYAPASAAGQELLGHELAHVIQQREGRVTGPQGKGGIADDRALEREADDAGLAAARGEPVLTARGSGAPAGGGGSGSGVMQCARWRWDGTKWVWPSATQPTEQPPPFSGAELGVQAGQERDWDQRVAWVGGQWVWSRDLTPLPAVMRPDQTGPQLGLADGHELTLQYDAFEIWKFFLTMRASAWTQLQSQGAAAYPGNHFSQAALARQQQAAAAAAPGSAPIASVAPIASAAPAASAMHVDEAPAPTAAAASAKPAPSVKPAPQPQPQPPKAGTGNHHSHGAARPMAHHAMPYPGAHSSSSAALSSHAYPAAAAAAAGGAPKSAMADAEDLDDDGSDLGGSLSSSAAMAAAASGGGGGFSFGNARHGGGSQASAAAAAASAGGGGGFSFGGANSSGAGGGFSFGSMSSGGGGGGGGFNFGGGGGGGGMSFAGGVFSFATNHDEATQKMLAELDAQDAAQRGAQQSKVNAMSPAEREIHKLSQCAFPCLPAKGLSLIQGVASTKDLNKECVEASFATAKGKSGAIARIGESLWGKLKGDPSVDRTEIATALGMAALNSQQFLAKLRVGKRCVINTRAEGANYHAYCAYAVAATGILAWDPDSTRKECVLVPMNRIEEMWG